MIDTTDAPCSAAYLIAPEATFGDQVNGRHAKAAPEFIGAAARRRLCPSTILAGRAEYSLKGQSFYENFDRHTHAQVRDQLERALEINPAFTPALYVLGFTLADQGRFGWEKDRAASCEAAASRFARSVSILARSVR